MLSRFSVPVAALTLSAVATAALPDVALANAPYIADARIENGRLVVLGRAQAGTNVILDGKYRSRSNAGHEFRFNVVHYPKDCIVKVATAAAPTRPVSAVVANCASAATSWRGDWRGAVTYYPGDLVRRDGSTWRARRETVADIPGSAPLDWELLAAKGAPGPRGPAGPAGQSVALPSVTMFCASRYTATTATLAANSVGNVSHDGCGPAGPYPKEFVGGNCESDSDDAQLIEYTFGYRSNTFTCRYRNMSSAPITITAVARCCTIYVTQGQ
ncbi:MAG: hypothetical protein MUC58_09315 [Rhizobiaceae bacterium]|nr:hypothetical protein [Rhizobiaceae bacterium]